MTTLTEIETAVDRLPPGEQVELLRHLESKLRGHNNGLSPEERDAWISRLDMLRQSIATGMGSVSSETILSESRDE